MARPMRETMLTVNGWARGRWAIWHGALRRSPFAVLLPVRVIIQNVHMFPLSLQTDPFGILNVQKDAVRREAGASMLLKVAYAIDRASITTGGVRVLLHTRLCIHAPINEGAALM